MQHFAWLTTLVLRGRRALLKAGVDDVGAVGGGVQFSTGRLPYQLLYSTEMMGHCTPKVLKVYDHV